MRTQPGCRVFMVSCLAVTMLALSLAARLAMAGDTQAEPDASAAQEAVDNCVACHTENDMLPAGHLDADVHMQPGLSCAGCHGGDPTSDDQEIAMSKAKGFRGVPERRDIPAFCARCHSDIEFMRRYQPRIQTDQLSQYLTSVHGHKLAQGDQKVAECASCHTSHAILPASDTRSSVHALNVPGTCGKCHGDADYMASYGIPTDQFDKFKMSVHGVALLENQDTGAPACNDCHGNHGATPPGTTSIGQVCGHCHVNNMQYFSDSRMGHAFTERGFHGCEECHGNHDIHKTSDQMVGTGDKAVCMKCHKAGDKGYVSAGQIYEHLTGLASVYAQAENAKQEVERIGMDDVEIGFLLQESHQSLIQARTLVHTFDPDRVKEKTDEGTGKARSALEAAAAQVKDFHVRRRGFGMATLFTTVLVLALFLWIRQMEAK
ncbi:MAG TPA: cytochrome c3 family protein [Candidatus Krumholzibacteria bacterium]|nr:cytochrome c3 family protein [Candidatus Krumholzibacteria bacterium]